MGREGIEDVLVIGVEPFYLLRGHHIQDNRSLVNGTEGKRFELKELAELRFHIRCSQKGVLYPYTESSLQIDTWLVSHRHTFMHLCGTPLHTYLVRAFVHTQITPHPMTCTMQIIQSRLPQALSGYGI
jgi:hypothetical protein